MRFRESRLGLGAKMSRRVKVMGDRCKGKKKTGDSDSSKGVRCRGG